MIGGLLPKLHDFFTAFGKNKQLCRLKQICVTGVRLMKSLYITNKINSLKRNLSLQYNSGFCYSSKCMSCLVISNILGSHKFFISMKVWKKKCIKMFIELENYSFRWIVLEDHSNHKRSRLIISWWSDLYENEWKAISKSLVVCAWLLWMYIILKTLIF